MDLNHDFKKYPELAYKQLQEIGYLSPFPQIEEDFEATVFKVVDGDTVRLVCDFRDFDFALRVLDYDAPEMNAGGEKAKKYLQSRILHKKMHILIDKFQRIGKYGRLLGKIMVDGINVSEEMFFLGLVRPFERRHELDLLTVEKILSEVKING